MWTSNKMKVKNVTVVGNMPGKKPGWNTEMKNTIEQHTALLAKTWEPWTFIHTSTPWQSKARNFTVVSAPLLFFSTLLPFSPLLCPSLPSSPLLCPSSLFSSVMSLSSLLCSPLLCPSSLLSSVMPLSSLLSCPLSCPCPLSPDSTPHQRFWTTCVCQEVPMQSYIWQHLRAYFFSTRPSFNLICCSVIGRAQSTVRVQNRSVQFGL